MKRTSFIFSLLLSLNCLAYPHFFKCGEEGRLIDHINPNETKEALLRLVKKEDANELIKTLCDGKVNCLQDFKDILAMGDFSRKISRKILNDTLSKLNSKSEYANELIRAIDNITFEQAKTLEILTKDLLMCQESKKDLDPDEFIVSKGFFNGTKMVKLFYPYHNNYMYISGCEGLTSEDCEDIIQVNDLKESIRRSLLMATDPYATIAVNVMEKFNRNFRDGMIWDKVIPHKFWLTGSMGCPSNQPNLTYTRSLVKPNGRSDGGLSWLKGKLENYLKDQKTTLKNDKSQFYCYRRTKSGEKKDTPSIEDTPQENHCCIELGFGVKNKEQIAKKVTTALMFNYIRKHISSPLTCMASANKEIDCYKPKKSSRLKMKDPAYNIQRYNGYSRLMGGAEPVNAWRAGVNHYEDPVYGFQVMDYILNTLMTNPVISNLIEQTKEELGLDAKNLLCANLPAGTYTIDSEYYQNRHRDAERLNGLRDMIDIPWDLWGLNQKRVMLQELGDVNVRRLLIGGENESGKFEKGIYSGTPEHDIIEEITDVDFSTMGKTIKSLKSAIKLADENPAIIRKMIKTYYEHANADRKTRGQASNYSWKRLTPEELDHLRDQY